jgi:cytochrome c-type biogenesis protein CcmH/NrfG
MKPGTRNFTHWSALGDDGYSKRFPFTASHFVIIWLFLCIAQDTLAQTDARPIPETHQVIVVELEGTVEVSRAGSPLWDPAHTNQVLLAGDRFRTGPRSRAVLRPNPLTPTRIDESTLIEVPGPEKPLILRILKGALYMFHREKPGLFPIGTPSTSALVRGTEFVLQVDEDGTTKLTMLDGTVEMTNEFGSMTLTNGQTAVVEPGKAPTITAAIEAVNAIQWNLYYPAVLDLDELPLSRHAQLVLADSLAAYREGDLLAALAKYPPSYQPQSDEDGVYLSALLLAVGQVEDSLHEINRLHDLDETNARLAGALRRLVAAVNLQASPTNSDFRPSTSSELLAESYYFQAQKKLPEALVAARNAVQKSPNFAFGWARVGELEFSFGRTSDALKAMQRSLDLAPRNAEALALKGYLLAAQNRITDAAALFEQAITVDGALGNAWLGLGLCRIRRGEAAEGLRHLQTAALLEPQRALLRSYLGKSFSQVWEDKQALKELELAKKLDTNDPTAWFYSAIIKQQENRVNEAVADLENSQQRNDNRSLFRSRALLDEDRAARGANLASVYRDAGMTEVAVREAARAVTYDYANDSAHLFMSDSYDELRDPTRFNLRYQTVWFNELLLANLLAPVGAGRLSQNVSQQEYSRLFEADGLHLANSTLYRSDNKSVIELASQFGTFGGTSYALDLDYQHTDGVRPNNDLKNIEWYTAIKQQVTPQDTALALIKYEDYHSGDNFQYYDPSKASPHFRFDEYEQPIVIGGWHHTWSPGIHTLILGGRLVNEQHFSEPSASQLLVSEVDTNSALVPFGVDYNGNLEIYTAELNQLFQWNRLTLSAGCRYQSGALDTSVTMTNPPFLVMPPPFGLFTNALGIFSSKADFERITGYGYLTAEALEGIWLTGGLAYEDMTFPRNFRRPPFSSGEEHRTLLGPKSALVWDVSPQVTVRAIYAKSLGGVSLDDSYRLEPTQLAGFPQTLRNVIPESVAGSVAAPENQTYGAALDLKFAPTTYAGVQFGRLESDVRQEVGYFLLAGGTPPYIPISSFETLRYQEDTIAISINQILGREFVVGANYKYSQAEFLDEYPQFAAQVIRGAFPDANRTVRAGLHEAGGYILFNHYTGFFARVETKWYQQNNSGYTTPLPSDDFFQHNLFAGWRFAHRRVELLMGLLNLTGNNYHLNPLNLYEELPRQRTVTVRLNFQF